ncbi:MAG: cation-transporting P-type ATPase, partial [Candidatus Helarchaeota archaeon]|nr:cation-transporting P-type ATPase [Candidatus Helarchaeota archaeon]
TAYIRSNLTYHSFEALGMFLAAVGLAVAAVPEGLPTIVTIALSIGVMKLVEKNAIIRKLTAVETLGCSTIICSDKTGTLTQNQMTVREILVNNKVIDVSGAGYEPVGKFYIENKEILPEKDETLMLLLKAATLCNDAALIRNTIRGNRWEIIGDPTEGALLTLSAKVSNDFLKEELELTHPRIAEVPFDSKRKAMSTIHTTNGKTYAYVKGAPEQIVNKSTKISLNGQIIDFDNDNRQKTLDINNEMASAALRVLGYAYKEVEKKEEYDENDEKDLIFLGLTGMIDPPRQEVKDALVKVKRAGMKAKMITGDNPKTAIAIANELKLTTGEVNAITGTDLNHMDDKELEEKVEDIAVFARTSPEHKVRICQALKNKGHVVAMTGDGINDARALKIADIGISMGITGTDVTQEASDMILTDDNFATIVNAIEQGREIYGNIRKFIFYLLSSNTGEILTMFFGIMIGFTFGISGNFILPLTAITILWINLVTDGLPATALSVDPPDPHVMEKDPRDPKEGVVPIPLFINMLLIGATMCIGTLIVFAYYLPIDSLDLYLFLGFETNTKAATMAFTVLVMFQLFNVFNCRSQEESAFQLETPNKSLWIAVAISFLMQLLVIYFPPIQVAFHTRELDINDWVIVFLVSSTVLIVSEMYKILLRRRIVSKRRKLAEKILKAES